jgi:hypothetical protein
MPFINALKTCCLTRNSGKKTAGIGLSSGKLNFDKIALVTGIFNKKMNFGIQLFKQLMS